ncbi:MAG: NUDIX domain-containing protein [Patescibacteria group bacterium]
MSKPKVISSVKALLSHKGKFLILKEELQKGDVWDLPGGKIEYGESPEEALSREVKEELDLSIKIKTSVGVWYFFSQANKHQVICHTFLCETVDDEIKIDTSKNPADENFTELKWMTVSEILNNSEIVLTDSLRKLLSNLQQVNR